MTDQYEYKGISEEAKSFAVTHLNENPSQVNAHIESLRRWVKSMPHLTCPTDSKFLLKFLRVAKFDHIKAEKRLDNFCTVRSSSRGVPEFFINIGKDDPKFEEFLDLRLVTPLGRSKAGEMYVLLKAGRWNSDTLPLSDYMVLLAMAVDIVVEEEETQIFGIRFLIDLKDLSIKSAMACSDPNYMKKTNKILHGSYPMRIKGQIFYNEPVIFDVALAMFTFFMNDKMKGRVLRIKDNIDKAMREIPGLEEILPTEYGGKGGPLDTCAEKWHKQFKEYYKNGNPLAGISVDESKRSQETLGYLAEYKEYEGLTLGMEGTYTKFDDVF